MNAEQEIYTRLFLIVPLLLYTGYIISYDKKHSSTVLFHIIVLFTIFSFLYFHLKYLVRVVRRIFLNEKYQKEFGEFLLMLAVFIVILCLYDMSHLKKKI